jgi:hypothetical protein
MFVILFAKVKKLLTEKLIYVIDFLCDAGRIQIPSYMTSNQVVRHTLSQIHTYLPGFGIVSCGLRGVNSWFNLFSSTIPTCRNLTLRFSLSFTTLKVYSLYCLFQRCS